MTVAVSLVDVLDRVKAEYNRMIERWETSGLYFHLRYYMKRYAHRSWVRYGKLKDAVCAVLALSRLGIPISTPTVNFLLERGEQEVYQKLMYLASYNILEPVKASRSRRGRYIRTFKLTKQFVEAVYKPLAELKKKEEANS